MQERHYNVVFVVCHPDDEALWIGGLLHALSAFPFVRAFVVCLSGADPDSPREAEFHAARAVAGYEAGVVLGEKLRAAPEPLPPVATTAEEGLRRLGLSRQDVDVLITHSPYGDEHMNPHHRQAYIELFRWSRECNVPFGYFSCLPVPFVRHLPVLRAVRRAGSLHLLSFARCTPTSRDSIDAGWREYLAPPSYYVQFLTDTDAKRRMLECYESIDLEAHQAGYASFTSPCESLYLFGDRAVAPFADVIEHMEIPGGAADLFPGSDGVPRSGTLRSVARRILPATIRRAIRRA